MKKKKQEEQNIETFEIITPLVKTIQLNNIEVVSSLIKKNNNIDTSNKYHITSYPYDFEKMKEMKAKRMKKISYN